MINLQKNRRPALIVSANKIKWLRKKLNLTQEDLAKSLGVSRQAISLYESGQRKPSNTVRQSLTKMFKAPTRYDKDLEQAVAADPSAYLIFVDNEEVGVGDGFDYEDGEDFLMKRTAELGSIDKLADEMGYKDDYGEFLSNLVEFPDDLDNMIIESYQGTWGSDLEVADDGR